MLKIKKRLSIALISLSWTFWMVTALAFPAKLDQKSKEDHSPSVSGLVHSAHDQFLSSVETIGIPHFQIDWSLTGKLNPDWITIFSRELFYKFPSFHESSLPFFDVKITFIQFYYTW